MNAIQNQKNYDFFIVIIMMLKKNKSICKTINHFCGLTSTKGTIQKQFIFGKLYYRLIAYRLSLENVPISHYKIQFYHLPT